MDGRETASTSKSSSSSNNSVSTNESSKLILNFHKNNDYTEHGLPPMYENEVNFVSPVLKKIQDKRKQGVFLGEVLAIVALQHVFILCLVLIGTFNDPRYLIVSADCLVWVALFLMFITSCFVVCLNTSLLRKLPVNITMLIFLTSTTGFLIASMALVTGSHTALWTIGTTTINIMALVIFTFQSKWDLTTWNVMCLSLNVIQTLSLIRVYVSHETALDLCLSGVFILLYFFIIIYDFRLMVERKHEIETSLEECSFVALNIHMDIIIMYLLRRFFDYIRSVMLTFNNIGTPSPGDNAHPAERLVVSPQEYTVTVGSDFTARCESEGLVAWRKRGCIDVHLGNSTTKEDNIYVSKLFLKRLTYKDVGFYDCLQLSDTSNVNISFYLYVDDPDHLTLAPSKLKLHSQTYKSVVIPCRPTASDVFVRLLTSHRDLMVDSNSRDPGPEERNLYFDPQRGIILPAHLMVPAWFIYICQFSKNEVIQEIDVDLYTWTNMDWSDVAVEDFASDGNQDCR